MMKNIFLVVLLITACNLYGQGTQSTTQTAIADSTCKCLTALDLTKITNKDQATAAITDCFGKNSAMLMKLADEKHIDPSDNSAMRQLGIDIAKDMMAHNCQAFIQISMKLAEKKINDEANMDEGSTTGHFMRIDTRGFNYLVVKDDNGSEKLFIWLRQFPGSEKFMNATLGLNGKSVKISWKEIEVYVPAAKGYYKLKEITGVDFL